MSILTVLPMIPSQANPTAISLIQTMYQMFFPMSMETPSSSTGSSKCKRFNRYISRIHKQETNTQLPSSSTSCLSTIRDNLAPTAPSAQDVPMDTTDVTSDSDEQANLNSTTHDQSITSTLPEAIAADSTCISAMPCLFETNSVPGVSIPVQVEDACLTDTGAPIDQSPLVGSPELAIESSATNPVESASVIETEIVENEVVPSLPSPSSDFHATSVEVSSSDTDNAPKPSEGDSGSSATSEFSVTKIESDDKATHFYTGLPRLGLFFFTFTHSFHHLCAQLVPTYSQTNKMNS